MRICTRDEFMMLAPGAVYQTFEPYVLGEICVKGETLDHRAGDPSYPYLPADFWRGDLANVDSNDTDHMTKLMDEARTRDVPLMFGEPQSREGYVEEGQLYAVWSRDDVRGLANHLLELCAAYESESVPKAAAVDTPRVPEWIENALEKAQK